MPIKKKFVLTAREYMHLPEKGKRERRSKKAPLMGHGYTTITSTLLHPDGIWGMHTLVPSVFSSHQDQDSNHS